MDEGSGTQLAFDNVLVLFADIHFLPGEILVKVEYAKGGTGYYLSQGHYEEITWEKADYYSNFTFYRADGSELELNVGKTHLGIADEDNFERTIITP